MKKVLYGFLSVIVFLIFVCSLISLSLSFISKKNRVPVLFGYGVFTVTSGSMSPELVEGDVIVVKSVAADTLSIGDIITFYSTDPSIYGQPNTHRITAVGTDMGEYVFTTKGDANDIEDRYTVYGSDIIGKLKYKPVLLSKLLNALDNKAVFLFGLVFPIVIVIFLEIKHISDTVKSGKDNGKRTNNTENSG